MGTIDNDIYERRENKVVKHNDIVQKGRGLLSNTEQKMLNFLVSLIKPRKNLNDEQPREYTFDIQTYCKVCGIDYNNGTNYQMVRNSLKKLRDTSWNVQLPDGTDTPISFLAYVYTNKGTGKAKIEFSKDMSPYLFDLCENTTRYELLNILPMKSKYSMRLYEICRSWGGIGNHTYQLDELRKLLSLSETELARFPDLRRKVLEKAVEEINEYTDLIVNYVPLTEENKRKVVAIMFTIKEKSPNEKIRAQFHVNEILDDVYAEV